MLKLKQKRPILILSSLWHNHDTLYNNHYIALKSKLILSEISPMQIDKIKKSISTFQFISLGK